MAVLRVFLVFSLTIIILWFLPPITAMVTISVLLFLTYKPTKTAPVPPDQLTALTLLKLELKQQYRLGHLSEDCYNDYREQIEILLNKQSTLDHGKHQSQLTFAWRLLENQMGRQLGVPPWHSVPEALQPDIQPEQPPQDTTVVLRDTTAALASKNEKVPTIEANRPANVSTPPPKQPTPQEKITTDWWPRMLSHTARLLMPFLWQNFGWFIGGFCFISGSIFLVAYTTGFVKAVTVLVVLVFYTFLLFWGSYQIRRRHPNLLATSYGLSMLAVLLVPLDLASATRLIQYAIPQGWLVSLLIPGVLVLVVVLTGVLRLVSGMMARHLQGEHPYLFMILASSQLVIPLIQWMPYELVIIGLHVSLLSILGYALRRFSQQWLQAIFIERQLTAYYVAGTLIYAAVVSFVHSVWGSGITLPAGYAGPFLMALCLLLLQVDIPLKQWVHKQALLGRFSFFIYGLSVIAIFFAWVDRTPLILTLLVGSVVYGMMLWHYLTWPPLYLLLACLSGLYGLLILQYFPYQWYFLLSLPGFGGLLGLHRFAQKRESVALASICCRVILILGISLLIWSLYHAPPSISGFLTALTATAITAYQQQKPTPCQATIPYRRYVFIGLITLTLAYTPLYGELSWTIQFSSGLWILSLLWSIRGLWTRTDPEQASVFLNSALLSLITSIVLIAFYHPTLLPWGLFAVSSVLLGLSLSLYSRVLLYATLLGLGMAGLSFKHYYLPDSSGRGATLIALAVWMLLWWLNYRYSLSGKAIEARQKKADITLLGLLPLSPGAYADHFALVKAPLEQAMVVLWLIGLVKTLTPFVGLLSGEPTQSVGIALFWSAVVATLIAGQRQWLKLVSLSLILLMSVLWVLIPVPTEWLFCLSTGYGALVWIGMQFVSGYPLSSKFAFLGWPVKDNFWQEIESIVYWTVIVIIAINLIGVGLWTFELPIQLQSSISARMPWIITLGIMVLFTGLTGWRYQSRFHSYMVIWSLILLVPSLGFFPLLSVWLLSVLTLLAIGLSVLARRLAYSPLNTLYADPLRSSAYLLYVLNLISLFPLWQQKNRLLELPLELVSLFILLAIGQLPLLRTHPQAAEIRGVGIALLFSIAFFYWAYPQGDPVFLISFWAFTLWGVGHYGLAWFNKRWSSWIIAPHFWPSLGLGLMVTIFFLEDGTPLRWQTVIPVTLYLILMLRNTYWKWLPWVTGFSLVMSGLVISMEWLDRSYLVFVCRSAVSMGWLDCSFLIFIFGVTLWSNFLLGLAQPIRRHTVSPWQFERLSRPLLVGSFLVIGFQLLSLSLITLSQLLFNFRFLDESIISWTVLLTLSCFHLVKRGKYALFIHILMLSLLNTTLLILKAWLPVPLSLSLWTVSSLLFYIRISHKAQPVLISVLSTWLSISLITIFLHFSVMRILFSNEQWLVFISLIGLTFSFGWFNIWKLARVWLVGSAILFWLFLHDIWWEDHLPWYALQNVVLAWIMFWLRARNIGVTQIQQANFRWLLKWLTPILFTLAGSLLGLAEYQLLLASWQGYLSHSFIFTLCAHLLLLGAWWRYHPGRVTQNAIFVYGLFFLIGWLGIYLRLMWFGLAPLSVWDTAVLMGSSYVLLAIWHLYPAYPLYHLTLVIPALAVLTVPLQLESVQASSALIAVAVLYLLIPRRSQRSLPLYLGLLALNAGFYLWIPGLVHDYKLLQLYTVPAAISLLFMLQLHHVELKPSILNAVRLTALSTLYASATLDVFLQEALSIFILALSLSLAGIVLGIALRIRAFLYSGTVFLMLNVIGQLVQFYPEERLGKAVVLMILGGFITGTMIWFNLQREILLARLHTIQASLATWS